MLDSNLKPVVTKTLICNYLLHKKLSKRAVITQLISVASCTVKPISGYVPFGFWAILRSEALSSI